MTGYDIWLYLWGAFLVGLGLGWWLFAGRGSAERAPNSAEEARKRARPTPIDPPPAAMAPPPAPAPGVMQAIPSEVLVSLRHQLEVAREARKEAEALASRLDDQRRAALARESDARGHQETLAARLDKARGDRDSLRAEVEAARRTIRRLEDDADLDLPTAQLDAEAAPEPPAHLRVSPPPPSGPNLSLPSPSAPRSLGATARVTAGASAPSATRRRSKRRGPVEVLFGPLSTVPVTPSVRSIPFELTARLNAEAPRDTRIDDLHIVLRFDLEDEGIALNGRRRGPLTLYRDSGLDHAHPVVVQVAVSTGFHSDTPTAARPPAIVGEHRVVIKIEYRLQGEADSFAARFAAAIPVVEDAS